MVDLAIPKKFQEQEKKINLSVPDKIGLTIPAQYQDNVSDVTDDQVAGAGTYAAALGAEVALAESIKMGATVVGGPIGYVIGGLGGGAIGSIAAQKLINPGGEISIGRVIADSFINLVPGSKITKGAKTVSGVVARTAGVGAAIGAGGVTLETAVDEHRLPTISELATSGLTAAALGGSLGFTGAKFNKIYNKVGGLTAKEVDVLLDPATPPDLIKTRLEDVSQGDIRTLGKNLMELQRQYNSTYDKTVIGERIKKLYREYIDNKALALDLQQTSGGSQFVNPKGLFKVTDDETDYYMATVVREGISANQLDGYVDFYKKTNDIAIDVGKRINKSGVDVNTDVNNYLQAKHSIKYNKENAASFGKIQKNEPYVFESQVPKERIVKKSFINPKTGKKEVYDVKEKYMGKSKVTRYKPLDGASGMSTSEAKSIIKAFEDADLQNTYKAVIAGKKHLSDEILEQAKRGGLISDATYKELREKYPDYVPLNRVMLDDVILDRNTTSFMQEVTQTGVRKAKGSEREVMNIDQNIMDNLSAMTIKANANLANQKFLKLVESPDNIGKADQVLKTTKSGGIRFQKATNYDNKDTLLSVYEDGKRTFIKFKDPEVAQAFKGVPMHTMSSVAQFLKGIGRAYISVRGQLLTRFNLVEFPVANKIRDMQETFINNMAKYGVGKASTAINPMTIARASSKIIAKKNLGRPAKDAEEQAIYDLHDEFKAEGGSTGGLGLYSRNDVRREIEKISQDQLKGTTKRWFQKFNRFVDKYNEVFEDSSRFATYRLAREAGATKSQAALAARNASFDPLKQGTEGETLRAMYLFANPAIQSSKNIIKSVFTKPKVFAQVMGGLFTMELVRHWHNSSIDEDYITKLKTQSGSDYLNNKNFLVITGKREDGTLTYASLPTAYPVVPFKVLAHKTARMVSGDLSLEEGAETPLEIASETLDAYNPVGGSLIPTPIAEGLSLITNKDGLGRDIRPGWNEDAIMHSSQNVYDFTAETKGGELAMALADTLRTAYGFDTSPENMLYLYETALGGPGRTMEQIINAVSKAYNGVELQRNEIPFLRRYIGETYEKKIDLRQKETLRVLEEVSKQAGSDSAVDGRTTRSIMREVLKAPESERANVLQDQIFKKGEENLINDKVLKRIKEALKDEKRGLTGIDKRIKGLPTKARADFIIKQISTLPASEVRPYLQDLARKGILTKDVKRELRRNEDYENIFLRKLQ